MDILQLYPQPDIWEHVFNFLTFKDIVSFGSCSTFSHMGADLKCVSTCHTPVVTCRPHSWRVYTCCC